MKPKPPGQQDSLESFAHLDIYRRERTGIPEAVLAEGKTVDQIVALMESMVARSGSALATRVGADRSVEIRRRLREASEYHSSARILTVIGRGPAPGGARGRIAVLAAGTSDLPVADEARVTAEFMGCVVSTFYDVGIAGIHRLVNPLNYIRDHGVGAAVVVAGMDGALPAVVRGLVAIPVIGVPTSVGYGYGGKGEAALMTMLQSCAPGLTVVNIDNGFGAGATAALIANRLAHAEASNPLPARKKRKSL